MHPQIHVNFLAVIAAMIASMVIGFLWYGPIFGKSWMQEMKWPADHKPDPSVMRRAFILMIIGTFLTAYVMAHEVQIWRPSVWGVGSDASNATYGFFAGFFVWLGFYVPVLLGQVGWENKSWKLFWINASHAFVTLQVVAMILANWR